MSTVKEIILTMVTKSDNGVIGIHTPEALKQASTSGSIYDREIGSLDKMSDMNLATFEEMLAASKEKPNLKVDNTLFVDKVKIGKETISVSAQRAANVVINALTESDFVSSKMVSSYTKTDGALEGMLDRPMYRIPANILRRSKASVIEGQIIKEMSPFSIELGHSIDTDVNFDEDSLMAIQKTVLALRSVMLSDTISEVSSVMDPNKLFQLQLLITNNRIVRNIVDTQLLARFPNAEDEKLASLRAAAMGTIMSDYEVAPLTSYKVNFGIQLARISKSENPQWTVEKDGRNFRSDGKSWMRIIQIEDSYTSTPVLESKMGEYGELIEMIASNYAIWAEHEVLTSLGLVKGKVTLKLPVIEPIKGNISTILGIDSNKSLEMRRNLFAELGLKAKEVVATMREDSNADSFQSRRR